MTSSDIGRCFQCGGNLTPDHKCPDIFNFQATTVKKLKERQLKWDKRFLQMCKFVSQWSKDPSTKCGSVIVRDTNKFVSLGYNGYASGVEDDHTLDIREEKYLRVVHAEANGILFAQRDLTGMTLYVYPLPPCGNCAALICQSGIKRVVSIIPSDSELKERWEKGNNAAYDQFSKKKVELTVYSEEFIC
jgi:dCMP deaminase